jgi:hypothetical protein
LADSGLTSATLAEGQPKAIRRGTYTSVKDLIARIGQFIDGWNDGCQPFTWTKPADDGKKLPERDTRSESTLRAELRIFAPSVVR